MKLTNKKVDEIIEAVLDEIEYSIETWGPGDYQVTPEYTDKNIKKIKDKLEKILVSDKIDIFSVNDLS